MDENGSLADEIVIKIAIDLCGVLADAHGSCVVHRDLKPSNIMLEFDSAGSPSARVLDFGLASINNPELDSKLSRTGEIFGTPLYMSPEQFQGACADPRTDIYSLGAVLYKCISGSPPHEGDTAYALMYKRFNEDVRSLNDRGLSSRIERIVLKCLERDPDDRYQNVQELLYDLEAVQRGQSIGPQKKRKPLNKGLIATAFLSSALLALSALVYNGSIKQNRPAMVPQQNKTAQSPARSSLVDWDSFDLEGQRLMNNGMFTEASQAFEKAVDLSGAEENHKLLSLEKLAIAQHILGQKSEEADTDKKIRTIKQNMRAGSANLNALSNAISLLPGKLDSSRKKDVELLSSDILASAQDLNRQQRAGSALALLELAIPRIGLLLGEKSRSVLILLSEKSESLKLIENWDAAKRSAQEAVSGMEKTLPASDPLYNLALLRLAEQDDDNIELSKKALAHLTAAKSSPLASSLLARAYIDHALALWTKYQDEQAQSSDAGTSAHSPVLTEAKAELVKGLDLMALQNNPSSIAKAVRTLAEITENETDFDTAQKMLIERATIKNYRSPLMRAEYLMVIGQYSRNGRQPYFPDVYK